MYFRFLLMISSVLLILNFWTLHDESAADFTIYLSNCSCSLTPKTKLWICCSQSIYIIIIIIKLPNKQIRLLGFIFALSWLLIVSPIHSKIKYFRQIIFKSVNSWWMSFNDSEFHFIIPNYLFQISAGPCIAMLILMLSTSCNLLHFDPNTRIF